MFGRKKKPKKTLLRRVEDFNYNWNYPQDQYKEHPNVGRVFMHPRRGSDIIVVAYKDDKTWWYRDTVREFLSLVDTTILEKRNKKKFSWFEKKGLELEEPRKFGHERMRRYKRKYRGGEDS